MRASLLAAAIATASVAIPAAVAADPAPAAAELAPAWVASIRAAAKAYQQWGRVDERPNLAPELCRAPLPADYGQASQVRLSAAGDGPHHDKLFYLWASDRDTYLKHATTRVGFAIVKQSFGTRKHVEAATAAPARLSDAYLPAPITWAKTPHGALEIDKPKDLYIMVKVGREFANSDDGWIYGTVAPDGTVTSAGRVEACMHCHTDATHERLFGL